MPPRSDRGRRQSTRRGLSTPTEWYAGLRAVAGADVACVGDGIVPLSSSARYSGRAEDAGGWFPLSAGRAAT